MTARLAGPLIMVATVGGLLWMGWPRPKPSPVMTVEVTGASKLSADARGTDVLATIDNPNAVPVDVTIRVRGHDITDRVSTVRTIGPYHGIAPGTTYPIRTYFSATPLQYVTFEVVDVRSSGE